VPDPAKVSPVVLPVKVNALPDKAPPESPVIEIELAAGDWNVGAEPVLPVNTCPFVPATVAVSAELLFPITTPFAVKPEFTPKAPNDGSADVDPISTWPVVPTAIGVTADVPSPSNTPWAVNVCAPVPPSTTGIGLILLYALILFPLFMNHMR
jgi:hypothetical protein